jgi:diguanylate cyclase (GGDEF)-like protein
MTEKTKKMSKVLICDDDRTHLLIMRETLSSQGFDVEEALNGEAAIEKYDTFHPNIVLLDVNMPKLDGYAVCQYIRAKDEENDTPILMITGMDDVESIKKAFEVGATDFLAKPIKWPLVSQRIRYMLRNYATTKSLSESQAKLQYLAYFDPLTKLPNRAYFIKQLKTFIAQNVRRKCLMAVLFIDLDDFKRINDTLGHNYGDVVLKKVATRLGNELRASDVVTRHEDNSGDLQIARLGGDEYTVLINDCSNENEVALVVKRILQKIQEPIVVDKYNLVLTASIGVSIAPFDSEDPNELLKFADMARYEAKANGKNCFYMHSKVIHERSMNRLSLEEYMRIALNTEMFELYYQPKIIPADNKVEGAEALIRLHHPTKGIISPAEFIPIAEDTGLIIDIGTWVIKQACLQISQWSETAADQLKVSINVSAKQVNHPDFIDVLKDALSASKIDPALLEVELTESVMMHNVELCIEKLKQIKQLGISLSIDDFGTGYSSLGYLKEFPVDTLKIDRSFVVGLSKSDNTKDRAIIAVISSMAKALHLSTVVEGVETEEQRLEVIDICQDEHMLIQGFYYSKPLNHHDFLAFVKAF